MNKLTILLTAFAFLIACKQEGYSQLEIDNVEYVSGFSNPVDISHAGDYRLFIVEQRGTIKIIEGNGSVLSTFFLDIRSRVEDGANEQGLLGLAFHPDYNTNGYFFVNYTGDGDSTHISRFSVSASDPDVADPSSELKILTIYQPYRNHNGGELVFGPDGYLYIGTGDGGSGGDPHDISQHKDTLLGKMLRIDVDNGTPYAIPNSNPFKGVAGYKEEIWALGLRNPWRYSFDRITGDLWMGDVGQNSWEEVNMQPASSTGGENYGWRCYEGPDAYNTTGCQPASTYTDPVLQYVNTGFLGDCSVTGGYVYRGPFYASMKGRYFYGDYCSDKIWSVRDSSGIWVVEYHGVLSIGGLSTFGEDADGELYIAGLQSGKIFKLVDPNHPVGLDIRSTRMFTHIFPNPFDSILKIQVSEEAIKNENGFMKISNLSGKEVYSAELSLSNSEHDLSALKTGIYILTVNIGDESKVVKLVKR